MDAVLPVLLNLDGFAQVLLLFVIKFVKMEFLLLQKFVMTIQILALDVKLIVQELSLDGYVPRELQDQHVLLLVETPTMFLTQRAVTMGTQ